jgi:predicted RNase H-like HicB family nuclease
MKFEIEFEMEEDGRWIAAVECLPGVLAYGSTQEEARIKAESLAQEVVQEQEQD